MNARTRPLLMLAASCTLAAGAHASTRYVAPCGNNAWAGVSPVCAAPLGPKRTVQAAINASIDGDQISVFPGTYTEAIDLNGKAVHLLGVGGPNSTIINGNGALHTVTCTSGESTDTIIEGLRITGGNAVASYGGGMLINLASPTIVNCQFLNNDATIGGGGVSVALGSPHFTGCVFAGNHANVAGGGLYANASNAVLEGCEFTTNDSGVYAGGAYLLGGSVSMIDCVIHFNDATIGGGIYVNDATASLTDCTIEQNESGGNGGGMVVWESAVVMVGTDVVDNITHQSGGGIYVAWGASLDVSEATIAGNIVDPYDAINAYGGGICVDGATLVGNDLVIVGNDAYFGGGVYSIAADVTLTNTLLWLNDASEDSGGLGTEAGSHVTLSDVDIVANTSPVAAGLASSGSTLEMSGGSITDHVSQSAAALSVYQGSVHADGVRIENNTTGGGFLSLGVVTLVDLSNGAALFESCDFLGNIAGLAGGAVYMTDVHATFVACDFMGNAATQGGAIAADNFYGPNAIEMRSCVVHSNDAAFGGGLALLGESSLEAVYTRFHSNDATNDGGAITSDGGVRLVNCDLFGNSAESGAGLNLAGGTTSALTNCRITSNIAQSTGGGLRLGAAVHLTVTHCTITDNVAPGGGSAFQMGNDEVNVINSIVWGNAGNQIGGSGTPDFRYSIIPLIEDGPGCFTADPMFKNPGIGDYRLSPASPAIDAGNNNVVPDDELDIDGDGNTTELLPHDRFGDPRVQIPAGGPGSCNGLAIVDLGAYEVAGVVPPVIISSADLNGDGIVGATDLAMLLGAWGSCAGGCCIADLNADGAVNAADLAILLGSW